MSVTGDGFIASTTQLLAKFGGIQSGFLFWALSDRLADGFMQKPKDLYTILPVYLPAFCHYLYGHIIKPDLDKQRQTIAMAEANGRSRGFINAEKIKLDDLALQYPSDNFGREIVPAEGKKLAAKAAPTANRYR
jgi:hypothetical protein